MKRKQNERRGVRALTAVTVWVGALLLAVWLVCMGCLTVGTAQYVLREIVVRGTDLAGEADRYGVFSSLYDGGAGAEFRREHPGIVDYRMLNAIDNVRVTVTTPGLDVYPGLNETNLYRDAYAHCQTAAVFTDSKGQVIHQSGDYVFFAYVTEDQWLARDELATRFGWIDLSGEEDERYGFLRDMYAERRDFYNQYEVMRLTGYFDGIRMEPLAIAVLTRRQVCQAADAIMEEQNTNSLQYTLSGLETAGRVEWDVRFDRTASVPLDKNLVTIYALRPEMMLYDLGGSITFQGYKYDSLLSCLSEPCEPFLPTDYASSEFHLTRTTVFDYRYFYDHSDYDPETAAEPPEPKYVLMTAVTANPLLIAMSFLRNVYIITFMLMLIGFLLLRRAVKKHLVKPLAEVNEAIASDWSHLQTYRDAPPKWREPRELIEHYRQTQDTLRVRKNEITRLTTALEYAKTAERNRRQMTSNIAHELKTPLAVIHSYAEGLKEHIAEDKRDKYIDVILSEAERTDGMVLEMLDLSRLEAGKVKLSRDDLSLITLTRSIFEKLEMAAQAKELQIDFHFPEDFTITADESRIAQVIENFATNAIKYTPVGGHIAVRIQNGKTGASFSIENESAPLSNEALNKVWDTFYRADEARSGGGTGLGLAISKSIVELHGGKCSVRNTKTGVEFGFTF